MSLYIEFGLHRRAVHDPIELLTLNEILLENSALRYANMMIDPQNEHWRSLKSDSRPSGNHAMLIVDEFRTKFEGYVNVRIDISTADNSKVRHSQVFVV